MIARSWRPKRSSRHKKAYAGSCFRAEDEPSAGGLGHAKYFGQMASRREGLARDTCPSDRGRARRGLWRRISALPRRRHAFRRLLRATVGHGDQVGLVSDMTGIVLMRGLLRADAPTWRES